MTMTICPLCKLRLHLTQRGRFPVHYPHGKHGPKCDASTRTPRWAQDYAVSKVVDDAHERMRRPTVGHPTLEGLADHVKVRLDGHAERMTHLENLIGPEILSWRAGQNTLEREAKGRDGVIAALRQSLETLAATVQMHAVRLDGHGEVAMANTDKLHRLEAAVMAADKPREGGRWADAASFDGDDHGWWVGKRVRIKEGHKDEGAEAAVVAPCLFIDGARWLVVRFNGETTPVVYEPSELEVLL